VYRRPVRCVLIHGFAGDPASWDDLALPGDRLALPGHRGGPPVQPDWASNLAVIGERLGHCDVIVGYSLGARVALGLVVAGRAPRAVLVSVHPGISDAERPARRASDAAWARLARDRGTAGFFDAWQAQPLFASQARAPARRLAARRARRLALDPEQLARSLEAMGLAEMPDYRPHVDHRFALVAGADDPKFLAIARALPAPLTVLPSCGHDPLLEHGDGVSLVLFRLATAPVTH
jgi:2-succinyl-6-hydroxy-2,4-cyclohexadiene-1-carboxylate synthase